MSVADVFTLLPQPFLQILHWLAGLIVFAEALNKLERTNLVQRGLSPHERLVISLKVAGWLTLALGSAGALVTPLLRLEPATLRDVFFSVGFALLIIRSRVKESAL